MVNFSLETMEQSITITGGGLAKLMNKGWAVLHSLGIFPDYMVTLEVVGRQ
jgi:hypothetical protein